MSLLARLLPKTKTPHELPQNHLLEACKRGDRRAQYTLYGQYKHAMFNLAVRFMGDHAAAEDALQIAFLKAFQNLSSYQGDATFGAWLKRIVINTCLNQLKKRREEIGISEELPDIPDEEEGEDFEEIKLKVEQVRQAIQTLPEGYRAVLTLYLLEGYEHSEIAEILQISISTSKTQYQRAKKKLRKILNENYPN
jgi:RNA polymerase sigma-70 factor (ECF subfamily)